VISGLRKGAPASAHAAIVDVQHRKSVLRQ